MELKANIYGVIYIKLNQLLVYENVHTITSLSIKSIHALLQLLCFCVLPFFFGDERFILQ